jgi:hypothetical protein
LDKFGLGDLDEEGALVLSMALGSFDWAVGVVVVGGSELPGFQNLPSEAAAFLFFTALLRIFDGIFYFSWGGVSQYWMTLWSWSWSWWSKSILDDDGGADNVSLIHHNKTRKLV